MCLTATLIFCCTHTAASAFLAQSSHTKKNALSFTNVKVPPSSTTTTFSSFNPHDQIYSEPNNYNYRESENDPYVHHDRATNTAELLYGIWEQIVEGTKLSNGESLIVVYPNMQQQFSTIYLDRLLVHLETCMDLCEDFGRTTIIETYKDETYGQDTHHIAGFKVTSYKDRNNWQKGSEANWPLSGQSWQNGSGQSWQQERDTIPKDDFTISDATKRWVNDLISGMNICPYTDGSEMAGLPTGRVRYIVDRSTTMEEMYASFWKERVKMEHSTEKDLSTTLLIAPEFCYNDSSLFERFSSSLRASIEELTAVHVEYHPEWTKPGERSTPGNYARRSPWPMINIIRTIQIQDALQTRPTGSLREDNENTLSQIGVDNLDNMLKLRDWSGLSYNSNNPAMGTESYNMPDNLVNNLRNERMNSMDYLRNQGGQINRNQSYNMPDNLVDNLRNEHMNSMNFLRDQGGQINRNFDMNMSNIRNEVDSRSQMMAMEEVTMELKASLQEAMNKAAANLEMARIEAENRVNEAIMRGTESATANEREKLISLRDEYETKLREVQISYENNLRSAMQNNSAISQRLIELENAHSQELKTLRMEHIETIEKIQLHATQDKAISLAELEDRALSRIQLMEATLDRQVQHALQQEGRKHSAILDDTVKAYSTEIENLKRLYNDVEQSLNRVQEEHAREKDAYMRDSTSVIENTKWNMKEESRLEKEKLRLELVSSYEAEIVRCKEDASKEIQRIRQDAIHSKDTELQRALNDAAERYERELAIAQSSAESQQESLKIELQQTNQQNLETLLRDHEAEIYRLNQALSVEAENAIAVMREEYETNVAAMSREMHEKNQQFEDAMSKVRSMERELEIESNKSLSLEETIVSYSAEIEQLSRAYKEIQKSFENVSGDSIKEKEAYFIDSENSLKTAQAHMRYEHKIEMERVRAELQSSYEKESERCKEEASKKLQQLRKEMVKSSEAELHKALENASKQHNMEIKKVQSAAASEREALQRGLDDMHKSRVEELLQEHQLEIRKLNESVSSVDFGAPAHAVKAEYEKKLEDTTLELFDKKLQYEEAVSRVNTLERELEKESKQTAALEDTIKAYSTEIENIRVAYDDIKQAYHDVIRDEENRQKDSESYLRDSEKALNDVRSRMNEESRLEKEKLREELVSSYEAEIARYKEDASKEIQRSHDDTLKYKDEELQKALNEAAEHYERELTNVQFSADSQQESLKRDLQKTYEQKLETLLRDHEAEVDRLNKALSAEANDFMESARMEYESKLEDMSRELHYKDQQLEDAMSNAKSMQRALETEEENVRSLKANLDEILSKKSNEISDDRNVNGFLKSSFEESLSNTQNHYQEEINILQKKLLENEDKLVKSHKELDIMKSKIATFQGMFETSEKGIEDVKAAYEAKIENLITNEKKAIDLAQRVEKDAITNMKKAEEEISAIKSTYEKEIALLLRDAERTQDSSEKTTIQEKSLEKREEAHSKEVSMLTSTYEDKIVQLENYLAETKMTALEDTQKLKEQIKVLKAQVLGTLNAVEPQETKIQETKPQETKGWNDNYLNNLSSSQTGINGYQSNSQTPNKYKAGMGGYLDNVSNTYRKEASTGTGATKKYPVLLDWKVNADGSINGKIHDAKGYREGQMISILPIEQEDILSNGSIITTSSGSKYRLM